METTADELCDGFPSQFKRYMDYVRGLAFEEKPNYKMLRGLFEQLFRELEYTEDDQWDWILHKQKLLDKRAREEEIERKKRMLANTRMSRKQVNKQAIIEEEQRKMREEEEERNKIEEAKRLAQREQEEKKAANNTLNPKSRAAAQADIEQRRQSLRMQISRQQELIARSEEEAARNKKEEEKETVEMIEYNGIMIPKDQLKQMQINALNDESREDGDSVAQISKHGSQMEITVAEAIPEENQPNPNANANTAVSGENLKVKEQRSEETDKKSGVAFLAVVNEKLIQ